MTTRNRASKRKPNDDLSCTSCGKEIPDSIGLYLHPKLKTACCQPCHRIYIEVGDLSTYKDGVCISGDNNYCRWCLDGGELIPCSQEDCYHCFCEECIKRNLPPSKLKRIRHDKNWLCFVCDSSQLDNLINQITKRSRSNLNLDNIEASINEKKTVVEQATSSDATLTKSNPKVVVSSDEKDIEAPKTREISVIEQAPSSEGIKTKPGRDMVVSLDRIDIEAAKTGDIPVIEQAPSTNTTQMNPSPTIDVSLNNMDIEISDDEDIVVIEQTPSSHAILTKPSDTIDVSLNDMETETPKTGEIAVIEQAPLTDSILTESSQTIDNSSDNMDIEASQIQEVGYIKQPVLNDIIHLNQQIVDSSQTFINIIRYQQENSNPDPKSLIAHFAAMETNFEKVVLMYKKCNELKSRVRDIDQKC